MMLYVQDISLGVALGSASQILMFVVGTSNLYLEIKLYQFNVLVETEHYLKHMKSRGFSRFHCVFLWGG